MHISYRIATVLYYLNDVEHGGETAFLIADNKTLDIKVGTSTQQNSNFNTYFSNYIT